MPHAVGDIIEVTYRQKTAAQQVLNIQHYRVASSSSVSSDVADNQSFADYLANLDGPGQLLEIWSVMMAGDWTIEQVRAQKVYPTRTTYAASQATVSGQDATSMSVPNLAFVVTKRGNVGTRHGIGSVHFSGFVPGKFAGGNIDFGVTTWWTNQFAPLYTANQTVPATNITYTPIIYNPTQAPNWQGILSWTPQSTARTMHRRTVGLGV